MFAKGMEINEVEVGTGVYRKVLASGNRLMTVQVRFDKGSVGAVHSHPHEQISYIVSGRFEYTINGKTEILSAGDSCYVNPDIPHGVKALEDAVLVDVFTPQREEFKAG